MKVSRVRINGMYNPVGYAFDTLRVSWMVEDTEAKKAGDVQIQVSKEASFEELLTIVFGDKLNPAGTSLHLELEPRTRYYVRVLVQGDNGESAVSETAYFETAKMEESWKGTWMKPAEGDTFHPEFAKDISIEKEVASARLYISGLGMYAAFLDGKQVGNEVLTPYYSDYHTELQYQTFDIAESLEAAGSHNLSVTLGNGWYKGKFGLGRTENNFGSEFMLLAEVHVVYKDGTEDVIGTDASWKYRASDIESSSIYDGEVINHLLHEGENNEWKTPVETSPEGKLVPRYTIPVIEKEDMPVKEIIHTPAGETVLDFGQNFAGYVTFKTFLAKGTKIVLDFGEILQDGNFYNANYRDAKSQFVYISDGREEEVKPHFTYFGFRYCRVVGWPGNVSADDFKGKAVYSDMEQTGWIETGHKKVNRLFLNALWGQKSNFVDLATDCPQRDERLGWTGDAQVFAGTASFNMDTAAFYEGFIHDLRSAQKQYDGIMPGVIPVLDPNGPIYSSIWGDIATFLPTVIYEHFGDKEALRTYYPMMKDWVDKITRDDIARGQQYLYNFSNQLGDWLALDGRTEQSNAGSTDEYYIGSCYYAQSVKMAADAAHALELFEEEDKYRALHEKIKEAIIGEYYTSTGRLAIDTQTGYIVALYTETYPDKQRVVDGLKTRLYKDCYKIKGGFCGAPLMCRVLAENGLQEEALYFLLQEDYPGWMHCIDLGATTIWERWNSVLDDGHLSGTMMNSLNHYAFGSVVEFLYRNVAGFQPMEAGCSKVTIAPIVNQKLGHMDMTYLSPNGKWRVFWEIKKNGEVKVRLEVPFGCTAMVGLPFYPEENNIGELTAGVYEFTYMPTEDLRSRYSRNTLFNDMLKDPEALKIIERVSPLLGWFLSTGNKDFYYESLDTIMGMSYMGFKQEEVEKLAEELCSIVEEIEV
ncbi:MAG: family 78 glycoside hydrolase catalytic domain [Eubacteriales bacterium]|nr:family 78 glycoside hydrolase catalytic domain [Eubacteriales bacterium]